MVPRAVLMKSGLVSLNTARQVNTAHPKITINSARPMTNLSKSAHSTVKWPIHKNTTFKNKGIDYDEVFAPVARIEAIRLFLAYASFKDFMDLKIQTLQEHVLSYRLYDQIDEDMLPLEVPTGGIKSTAEAEAVNTACYVQNRVLVTKPHNKTPYELFLGRKQALGFMRPFGCLVTILNTIDHLGKFDGKADKGFFVGYSINNTKACDDAGKARMETVPGKDYILLPLWTDDPPFSQSSKSSQDDGSKPSSDNEKKVDEDPRKDSESIDQEKDDNVNSTNNVNAASTNEVNAVGGKTSIELLDDPNMPALEDIVYSDDDEDVGTEADMNNLDTTIQVSPIPTTRIHKDHPVEQIIRDLNSAPQTRRMTKNLEEHGLFSSVQQRTNHKDFQNCLFACFLSQVEPKKVIQALQDPSWNKKDERGIVIKNKARLVSQGYIQEEGIDYDEVFAPLQALVDGKKVMITKSTIRRDLHLEDAEGVDCLPNATIFEQLTLMGYEKLSQKLTFCKAFFSPQWKFLIHTILQCLSAKTTAWNEFSSTMASVIICLTTYRGKGSTMPTDPQHTPTIIQPSTSQPQLKQRSRRPKRKDTKVPQPSGPTDNVADEAVYEEMDDSLERAATTATSLDAEQDRGNINKTQSKATPNEPSSLGTSSGGGPRRQETMGDTIAQTGFENVSKTSNDSLLAGVNTPRSDEDRLKLNELMEFCTKLQQRDGDEVLAKPEVTIKDVNLSVDEVTLAQALAALKSAKVQEKANVVEEPSESITTTPTLTTTTAATTIIAVKAQDKGKGIMVEEPMKMKKKDQISLDEELAFKLQAEEEERLAREKAQREEEANIVSWDNVQAMIDADYQMAQQMQAEEQENLSIEEKSKLFVQLLEARKEHFAAIRAQEIRNKPPTKAQKRNTMSTYQKKMAGYKHNQLKNKSFNDIQKLFDKAIKRVNTFVDMNTGLVKGSEVEQKLVIDEDKETAELQRLIEVVPDKEEVAIDDILLETKPPSIVDYKIHKEGKKTCYQIIRADGSSKMYLVFSHMLKSFNKEDLETLWKLVKAKHGQQGQRRAMRECYGVI
ncbi:hypothetical protein Tco_0677188 [Tanacetum coccineum]